MTTMKITIKILASLANHKLRWKRSVGNCVGGGRQTTNFDADTILDGTSKVEGCVNNIFSDETKDGEEILITLHRMVNN